MPPLCLIVDADAGGACGGSRELGRHGLKPYAVSTLAAALGLVDQWRFDAVLVDADRCGDTLLRHLPALRERSAAPIVLLWSETDERRQIEGLDAGATAIVAKPASSELLAAKLRRLIGGDVQRAASSREICVGPLRLDARRAKATTGGTAIDLTPGEFALLSLLAAQPGEFVDRESIVRALRRPGARRDKRPSADMHICRLRKKLREAGAPNLRVETVYGRGYSLSVYPEPARPPLRRKPS